LIGKQGFKSMLAIGREMLSFKGFEGARSSDSFAGLLASPRWVRQTKHLSVRLEDDSSHTLEDDASWTGNIATGSKAALHAQAWLIIAIPFLSAIA
jgi:hypothetical protein